MGTRRRGTIYIITLGLSLITATLATAGLLAVRAQRNRSDLLQHMVQARLNARSALETALLRIADTGTWRADLANATPAGDAASGFTVIDPVDGSLEDDPLDRIVIAATGVSGPATQKIEVRLKARRTGLRCLEPVIHTNNDLVFKSTTVVGDRPVSSNHDLRAEQASQIHVDAEAEHKIEAKDGSVFHANTTLEGDWPREMPDPDTVLDYYLLNGTPIGISDLPLWDAEQIVNPDMGDGTTAWDAYYCNLSLDAESSDTPWSIRVVGRWTTISGPCQAIDQVIQSGETYTLSADVRTWTDINMRIDICVESSGSGTQRFSTPWRDVDEDHWSTIEGNVTPTWTGSLISAYFLVRSEYRTNGFRFDDASLRVANTPDDCRVIHRNVLSPTNNPYGAGNTNPDGIYVIDCEGKRIVVKDCRIVGTLVLLDQNEGDSRIRGSINWEPAVFSDDPSVPNLPILLSNKELRFDMSAADLDEGLVNANFNPTDVPYSGSEDSDKADAYPSILKGIVYTKKKVYVESDFRIHGALVAHEKIEPTGANINATYEPIYYWYNAPPGFQDNTIMEIVPGSFRQLVDE